MTAVVGVGERAPGRGHALLAGGRDLAVEDGVVGLDEVVGHAHAHLAARADDGDGEVGVVVSVMSCSFRYARLWSVQSLSSCTVVSMESPQGKPVFDDLVDAALVRATRCRAGGVVEQARCRAGRPRG